MRPPACPECSAPRDRLAYLWRITPDQTKEEAWTCRRCGLVGPWRLASTEVLTVIAHQQTASTRSSSASPARDGSQPAVKLCPPAAASRAAIRALFEEEDA